MLLHNLSIHPANGTVITDDKINKTYVIAGGAPVYVSNWANIGGVKQYTVIDSWSLTNLLLAYPQEDTLLKGYVSQNEYQVFDQQLVAVANPLIVNGTRVIVDDLALQGL
ncbi:MAG: hypothetical protein M3Q79_01985 [bacterium]|nr:hypothetical protein [bacterium]